MNSAPPNSIAETIMTGSAVLSSGNTAPTVSVNMLAAVARPPDHAASGWRQTREASTVASPSAPQVAATAPGPEP